jgi:hypothetical protein
LLRLSKREHSPLRSLADNAAFRVSSGGVMVSVFALLALAYFVTRRVAAAPGLAHFASPLTRIACAGRCAGTTPRWRWRCRPARAR